MMKRNNPAAALAPPNDPKSTKTSSPAANTPKGPTPAVSNANGDLVKNDDTVNTNPTTIADDADENGTTTDVNSKDDTATEASKNDPIDVDIVSDDKTKADENTNVEAEIEENKEITLDTSVEAKAEEDAEKTGKDENESTTDVGDTKPEIEVKPNEKIPVSAADGDSKGVPPPGAPSGAVTHPLDEIMAMLKTGYPLLALSMETMVDQIQLKFKPQADEDMYRLVVALYNEGTQVSTPGNHLKVLFYLLYYILAIALSINES
jgi:transformation/transcription domain-associated protein